MRVPTAYIQGCCRFGPPERGQPPVGRRQRLAFFAWQHRHNTVSTWQSGGSGTKTLTPVHLIHKLSACESVTEEVEGSARTRLASISGGSHVDKCGRRRASAARQRDNLARAPSPEESRGPGRRGPCYVSATAAGPGGIGPVGGKAPSSSWISVPVRGGLNTLMR